MNRTELLKTAKPILFNTEMVWAILDGRKTETRRPIKQQPEMYDFGPGGNKLAFIPPAIIKGYLAIGVDVVMETPEYLKMPYKEGDILYVREAWANTWTPGPEQGFVYKADGKPDHFPYWGNVDSGKFEVWRPSIHMPKEAARIFLQVTEVKAERVQEITEAGALDEGINKKCYHAPDGGIWRGGQFDNYRDGFHELWDTVYLGRDIGWHKNPWVWVIKFERLGAEA